MHGDVFLSPCVVDCMQGRVALLGDSAHAMQPNLGQGGCMAIEDGYQLARDLGAAAAAQEATGRPMNIQAVLKVPNPGNYNDV